MSTSKPSSNAKDKDDDEEEPDRSSANHMSEVKIESPGQGSKKITHNKDGDVKSSAASAGASIGGTSSAPSSWAPRHPPSDATSMNSSMPSSYPNRKRKQNKADKKKREKPQEIPTNQPSLSERLGNSAISSTIGILKIFGDVTLSTTGTILSPSLKVTQHMILPQIFAALADHISNISPQRLKDWFRIVSASVHHLISVIVSTDRGSVFRQKVVRTFGDVVNVASSDVSRQAIMDGMGCFVKLSEALNTPEFRSFLDQLGVWGCRMVDAIGQDKNKQLIHDFWDLIWSAIELSNDPATVLAMAEVAAYLCHALEMEDAAIHALAKEREEINQKAARKRKERNQYQSATYRDPYLLSDPNATVEEVILSALGIIQKTLEEAKVYDGHGERNDIPGNVVCRSEDDDEDDSTGAPRTVPSPTRSATNPQMTNAHNLEEQEVESKEETEEQKVRRKVCKFDHHDIDTEILREKITERSAVRERERLAMFNGTPSWKQHKQVGLSNSHKIPLKEREIKHEEVLDDGKIDIEELSLLAKASSGGETPKKSNKLHFDEDPKMNNDEHADFRLDNGIAEVDRVSVHVENSLPLDGETPVAHFYRVLDEVLTKRRDCAMDSVLSMSGVDVASIGDNATVQGTLKGRLRKLRAKIGPDKHLIPPRDPVPFHHANLDSVEKFLRKNKRLVFAGVLVTLYFAVIFVAFGCYGMYKFAFPSPAPRLSYASVDPVAVNKKGDNGIQLPLLLREDPRKQHNDEYVIRIIREVVHVNDKGETVKAEQLREEL